MAEEGAEEAASDERAPWRLRDHIGIISGLVLGAVGLFFLVVIATGGSGGQGAFGVVVVVVIGVALIYLGGQMRAGSRR